MLKESLFSMQNCSFSYTKLALLKEISLAIHSNDKIALIGKNGVGKSTLMEIIAREKNIGEGEIWFHPEIRVGYLKQKIIIDSELNVFDFLRASKEEVNDSYKIDIIIDKLKIKGKQIIRDLSGGLKRKVFLAQLLVKEPNVILLDEPTNHLDIESIEWLEKFLFKDFSGAYLVVSHDRKFLSNVTNKVFWMDRGNIRISPKGFYNFEIWSNELIEHEKRELKNKDNFLRQELEWLSKGVKARRKRNERRRQNVRNLEKKVTQEKSDFLRSIKNVKLNQTDFSELGPNVICQFFNISKSFFINGKDYKVINDFNFKLTRGQKIGILGKNGSGKSTLLKIINGIIKPDSGTMKLRDSIKISYFDQENEQVDERLSIKENFLPSGGDYIDVNGVKKHICGYLKNFLFDPSSVNDKVSTLSGGQKNRLCLAKTLAKSSQLLILDEPTNDLDLETLDILIDFLENYNGTLLVSSHDRDFLDQVTKKNFFFDGNGNIEITLESCSEILNRLNKNDNLLTTNKNKSKLSVRKEKPKNIDKLIKKILKRIENIENNIENLTKSIELNDMFRLDKENFFKISEKIKFFQAELSNLEEEWKNLEEKKMTIDK